MRLEDLENWQFSDEIFKNNFTQRELLSEAFRRFQSGEMEGFQIKELGVKLGSLKFQRTLDFNFTLTHDTPEVRMYLFSLVKGITVTLTDPLKLI